MPDVLRPVEDGTLGPSPLLSGPFGYDDAVEVLLGPPPAKPVFVRDQRCAPAAADLSQGTGAPIP